MLRTVYIGHNQIFIIGDKKQDFRGKMQETIDTVKTIVGLPAEKFRYKKFMVNSSN